MRGGKWAGGGRMVGGMTEKGKALNAVCEEETGMILPLDLVPSIQDG